MDTANKKWNELTVKDQTISYINHIEEKYYRSYLKESEDFERINNIFHLLIIVSGFLTTIILALKGKFEFINHNLNLVTEIITLSLPSIGAVMLLFVNQRGYKRKEELRENARIKCKYLLNKAKIDFTQCQTDEDYKNLYYWLNDEIKKLQLYQSSGYFNAQETMYSNKA